MGNLIRADIYRLRKGTTLLYTALGMLAVILLVAFVLRVNGALADETPVSTISESTAEAQRAEGVGVVVSDIVETTTVVGFTREMLAQNLMAFLLLPLFIAVFADDYNNGAYRNLLSFETNRKKIYLTKLLLSFLVTMAFQLLYLLLSGLVGGVMFGFGGVLTAGFWVRSLVSILLMSPLYLAFIAIGHMVTALTRKTSVTIAVYLVMVMVWSSVIMLVAVLLPGMEWITLLDLLSGISYLAYYWVLPLWEIVFYLGFGLAITLVCGAVGMRRYVTADMP